MVDIKLIVKNIRLIVKNNARATLLSPKNGQGVPRFRILTNQVGAKLIWFRSLAASLKLPIFWQTPLATLVTKFDSSQKVKVGNKYWKRESEN